MKVQGMDKGVYVVIIIIVIVVVVVIVTMHFYVPFLKTRCPY